MAAHNESATAYTEVSSPSVRASVRIELETDERQTLAAFREAILRWLNDRSGSAFAHGLGVPDRVTLDEVGAADEGEGTPMVRLTASWTHADPVPAADQVPVWGEESPLASEAEREPFVFFPEPLDRGAPLYQERHVPLTLTGLERPVARDPQPRIAVPAAAAEVRAANPSADALRGAAFRARLLTLDGRLRVAPLVVLGAAAVAGVLLGRALLIERRPQPAADRLAARPSTVTPAPASASTSTPVPPAVEPPAPGATAAAANAPTAAAPTAAQGTNPPSATIAAAAPPQAPAPAAASIQPAAPELLAGMGATAMAAAAPPSRVVVPNPPPSEPKTEATPAPRARSRTGDAAAAKETPTVVHAAEEAGASAGPGASTGALLVKSDPQGAEVSINGVLQGRTPLVVRGLGAGTRVVRLDLPGYRRWSWAIAVVANKQTPVTVKLQPDTGGAGQDLSAGQDLFVGADPASISVARSVPRR